MIEPLLPSVIRSSPISVITEDSWKTEKAKFNHNSFQKASQIQSAAVSTRSFFLQLQG